MSEEDGSLQYARTFQKGKVDKATTGQNTGIEPNPEAPDNKDGQREGYDVPIQRPGQTSDRTEIGGDQFNIGPENERRTLEPRDRRKDKP